MREKLEAKLKLYQEQFEQTKANANALQGAVQAVQQLINELDAEAAKTPEPKVE